MDTDSLLADNWLELATAHAVTGWLKSSLRDLLPALVARQITLAEFADQVGSLLEARKLTTPAQQKNPRSNVVQALKSFDPEHPAIALVSLSTAQYRTLNDQQRGRLALRETKYFTTDTAQTLVDRATSLLDSPEWSDVAAGLAVLIGRRISEILLSNFAPKTAWSILFSEMSKKPQLAKGLEIEIPTLAPAQLVLAAISRLQTGLRIDDLKLDSLTPKYAFQKVNQRYSEFVVKACQARFSDLIPNRSDRSNLYTHIFRACYATVAAHWFCPPNIPEHHYKAEIQGHFTLTPSGQKLPNYSARANYDDYAIGTPDGNRDGRLGIKLGLLPQLQVITAFQPSPPLPENTRLTATTTPTDKELDLLIDKESAKLDKESDTTSNLGDRDSSALPAERDRAFEPEASPSLESVLDHAPPPSTPDDVTAVEPANKTPSPAKKTPSSDATSVPKPIAGKHKRPPLLAEDLERMTKLMAQQGVFGSHTNVFHGLLNAFEQLQHQQQAQPQQDLEVIRWFTTEIDSLRARISQLEQERDSLQTALLSTDQFESLKAENAQLKEQLQDTQSRLASIHQLLGRAADATTPTLTASPISASTAPATLSSTKVAQNSRLEEGEEKMGERLTNTNHLLSTTNHSKNVPPFSKPCLPDPNTTQIIRGPDRYPQEGAASFEQVFPTSPSAPATAETPATTSSPSPKPAKHSRPHQGETAQKIHQIVDAMIRWNSSQQDNQRLLRISIPPVKALASALGANYQPTIQQVLKEREDELNELHARLMLGFRHNATVPRKDELLAAIARDFLGLENWADVHYIG